jgi:uncharacterized membrane protein
LPASTPSTSRASTRSATSAPTRHGSGRSTSTTTSRNGIYNSTASNQTKTATTKPGTTVSFAVRIENDGTDADSYTVNGGGPAKGYAVVYAIGAADYTTKIVNGSYTFTLSPGQYKTITMKVTVKSSGSASWSSLVKVTSGHDSTKVDAVKGVIKRG